MSQDEDHLRLLAIFHYVVAGLAGLFSLLPVFHLLFGLVMVFAPDSFGKNGDMPPAFFGWFFVAVAVVFITFGLAFSILMLVAGRSLAQRRRYLFCLVMAGVECMFLPFGTVLGVFTIIVLLRDSVKGLFGNC